MVANSLFLLLYNRPMHLPEFQPDTQNHHPDSLLSRDLVVGNDLVYVPRLRKSHDRYGVVFFSKMLTPGELNYCQGSGSMVREAVFIQKAAGRIAVKEAVSKALGVGLNGLGWGSGVHWQEIEVISQSKSPPCLKLSGGALRISEELGIRAWRFSFSHDGDYAAATVIGLI